MSGQTDPSPNLDTAALISAADAASDALTDGIPAIRGPVRASPRWHRFRALNNAGTACISKGDVEGARENFDAAYRETLVDGAETDGEAMDSRARVLGNLAILHENAGALDVALACVNDAIAAATAAESLIGDTHGTRAVRVNLLISRAQTHSLAGRSDEALGDTADALAHIDGAHHESQDLLRFSAHNTRAGILVFATRFEEAEAEAHRARLIAEATMPQLAVHPYATLASIADHTGGASAHYAAVAHELTQIAGDPASQQLTVENLARRAMQDGRYDEAETRFAEAERIAASAGLGIRAAACRYGLAGVALARGQTTRAHHLLASAIHEFERSGAHQQLIECHVLAGAILAIERKYRRADAAFLRARALCTAGFERARIDARRAETIVEWSGLVHTDSRRASLLREALDLAAPAALATDAMRHRFAPGPVRERWTSTVAAPSMSLAFAIAASLLDTAAIVSLIENASSGNSLQSDGSARGSREAAVQAFASALTPDARISALFGPRGFSDDARDAGPGASLPAAATAILAIAGEADPAVRLALPPQLDLALDVDTPLDAWVAAAEQRYDIRVRDRVRLATW